MQYGEAHGQLVTDSVGRAGLEQSDLEGLAEVVGQDLPGELELVGEEIEEGDVREAGFGL